MSPDTARRIALFIDGANFFATAKALGFDVDYKRLLEDFRGLGTLVRVYYYTAVFDNHFSSTRPLIDWLGYNGYTVVTKPSKEFIDAYGRRKIKGSIGIELAVHALELAEHLDEMVLFSGDGDFRPLVEAVQRRGVHVTVVSTINIQPPMIADELRRQADVFMDIVELRPRIARISADRRNLREGRLPPDRVWREPKQDESEK
ncbi:NYN domain-containing protein [Bradyrhizobium guangzhouense]|uniref:LabA-like NYN domain-containing protein n=1 Tax=Bradyrhizobium guangzhouense TaxID=1325095 RepID=UPI001009AF9E|nr:NYN domain-containing protein [Bradyrhizobium guangzhouense]RXH08320.1 NYN domain-containing protein [Bradyrhizobium guangzhouense]